MDQVHRFLFLAIAFAGSLATVEAATYHDPDNCFSLQVPDDWVRLPEEVTDAAGRPCPAWRFEPQDDSLPALTIHVLAYEAFGIKGQITDEGIQAALDGQRSLFENDSEADIVSAEQEPLRRIYNLTVDHHVQGAGTVRARHAMAFGRDRAVALSFIDLKDAWDSSEKLRQTIFSSFAFDVGSEFDASIPDNHAKRQGWLLGRLLGRLLLVGLVAYGIAAIFRGLAKARHP